MPAILEEDGAGCLPSSSDECVSLVPGSRYGHVQHAAGRPDPGCGRFLTTPENPVNSRTSVLIFDPRRGTWTRSRHDLPVDLAFAVATDLPDGRVLIAGGISRPARLDSHRSWISTRETRAGLAGQACVHRVAADRRRRLRRPGWDHVAAVFDEQSSDGRDASLTGG